MIFMTCFSWAIDVVFTKHDLRLGQDITRYTSWWMLCMSTIVASFQNMLHACLLGGFHDLYERKWVVLEKGAGMLLFVNCYRKSQIWERFSFANKRRDLCSCQIPIWRVKLWDGELVAGGALVLWCVSTTQSCDNNTRALNPFQDLIKNIHPSFVYKRDSKKICCLGLFLVC